MVHTPTESPADPEPAGPPRPRPRGYVGGGLTVLLLALMWPAQVLNGSALITSVAQAQIAQHFHTTNIAWFSLVPVLVGAVLTPFVVKFGEQYGKRRVMLVITALGLVGDVIAALAPTFTVILVGRAVAACYVPIAALVFAAVRDLFPARRIGSASGLIGSTLSFVIAICPLLTGWLLDNFGFRGALWFVTACTGLAFVLIMLFVPETPLRARGETFDWWGGILLGGGIAALTYGVGQGVVWGWTDPRTLAFVVGSLVAAVAFVQVERAVRHPLMDIRMLKRRDAATAIGAGVFVQGTAQSAGMTLFIIVPLYPSIPGVSDGLGWSATHAALVGLPGGVLAFAIGATAGTLSRWLNPRLTWWAAIAIATTGMTLMGFYHHNEIQWMVTSAIVAVGTGLIYAFRPILLVSAVSDEEQSVASGMAMLLLGVVISIMAQVAFSVARRHSVVVDGTAFYRDTGYQQTFFTLAGALAVGLVVSLFIPKLRLPDRT
ncbi:MFS transporter [Streptomyces sp. NPDC091292]|uniref:MFS transporter n=1 Tax=Streptomyces sp. NPDC091292 TaxID=3365991 RepID=UPI0037F427EE